MGRSVQLVGPLAPPLALAGSLQARGREISPLDARIRQRILAGRSRSGVIFRCQILQIQE